MSEPTPEYFKLARQLAQALHLPDWEHLSDSELEDLLDTAVPEPISDSEHEAILARARQLIHQWETASMAMTPHQNPAEMATRQTAAAGAATTGSVSVSPKSRTARSGAGSAVILAGIALFLMAVVFYRSDDDGKSDPNETANNQSASAWDFPLEGLRPTPKQSARLSEQVAVGSLIETKVRERRRVTLPDGSVLFINENTRARVESERKLLVEAGEVFVEVVPANLIQSKTPFVVETPGRNVTALGTKFLVKAKDSKTDVLVTQGKVQVSGEKEPVTAGQLLKEDRRLPAPRASEALLWTKELLAKAASPLVPKSEHAGGALVAVDPNGQEMQLSLRKQHLDVHIEDGFARTTIDQTYFNASWSQMEGTFYFPLPPDASLSRLAMYVGENLMEGGMAERDHARNVFEQIRYTRRDPALLEWLDGSTFKMRVFPLEARQEKRIIISYTQRLDSAYGEMQYRFPAGHSLELIRDWSTQVLVKDHGQRKWDSPSHALTSRVADGDLILENAAGGVIDDRDLVIALEDHVEANPQGDAARFSQFIHEGHQYLMLRFRPDLKGDLERKPRNWVFLFESAGNRDSLLARVQIEVLHTLLKNAEHADTFSIITAGTRPKVWKNQPAPATPENIEKAVAHLNQVHLIGALNLEKALAACQPFLKAGEADAENTLVHLGAGVAVLGEKDTKALLRKIPQETNYVGVGVGKRWSEAFMKAAANKTGGHITQINPDEEVGWRAFELLSLLNSPRVLDVKVLDDLEKYPFLQFSETLAQGEELCAVTRIGEKESLPKELTVSGKLAGKHYEKTIPVENIAEGAGYLPRTWAKLEIDRLVADGAEQHKAEIIQLSKEMYVMSPFTSLLVLENDAMYTQFNVDRGRKDHWALYPCPLKIPVVYEPDGNKPVTQTVTDKTRAKSVEDLFKTVLVRTPPITYRWPGGGQTVTQGLNVMQLYTGAFAGPVQYKQHWNYWGMETPRILLEEEDLTFTLSDRFGPIAPQLRTYTNGVMNTTVYPDGDLMMPIQRGNVWFFDADIDGVSNTTFLGSLPMSGEEWSGPVTGPVTGPVAWSRLGESGFGGGGFGLGVPMFGMPMLQQSRPGIAFSPDGGQLASGPYRYLQVPLDPQRPTTTTSTTTTYNLGIGPFYPVQQVPLGWRKTRLEWDDGRWGYLNYDAYFRESNERMLGRFDITRGRRRPVQLQISGGDSTVWNTWRGDGFSNLNVSGRFSDKLSTELLPALEQVRSGFIQPPAGLELPALDDWPVNGTIVGLGRADQFVPEFAISIYDRSNSLAEISNWSVGRFGDLTALAPGMNTNRLDLLSLLESQGPAKNLPKRGKIDPKAQELIERARRFGWETVTLPAGKGKSAFTLRADAKGRFVYERTLTEGLKERVVSDGETLLHLYDQLGLGARREVSRFHRAQLRRLAPWLVPPAEDLAIGCDLKFVNDRAIAVLPIQEEKAEANSEKSDIYLLMVFSEEGRLQERRLMNAETNKPLVRVHYGPTGTVSVFDKDDKRVSQIEWKRTAASDPNLEPDLKDLVVLPMPFRSPESFLSANEQQLANTSQFGSFDDETILRLLGAYHASGNVNLMNNLINQRHFGKEDFRIGLFVLQASVYQQTGLANQQAPLTEKHPNSPLAQYLWQHFQWSHAGGTNPFLISSGPGERLGSGPDDGFIQRLAIARDLFVRWQTGLAWDNKSAAEIQSEREQSLKELKKLQSPELAWMLLGLMQSKDKDPKGLSDYIKAADEFAEEPSLSLSARFQAALWRSEHGETEKAIEELESIAEEFLKAGILPPISERVRESYVNHDGIKAWTEHLENLQNRFLKEDRRHAALWLAIRAAEIKADSLSERLFAKALKDLDPKKEPGAALLAIGHLIEKKEYAASEKLISPFLKAEGWSEQVQIWRKAAEIASLGGDEALSVARQERALQLEYETLPDLINLQTIRNEYSALLSRMESLANAKEPEEDLLERTIRLADRWRLLDPDDTAACQAAARIVARLGDEDLAWDYLTTPLADKPNESAPWVALAQVMAGQQKIDWADRAYRQAFEAEATNAQILWDHAELMRQQNREENAQELYEKLANETWQPRFSGLKTQAGQRLNEMKGNPVPQTDKVDLPK